MRKQEVHKIIGFLETNGYGKPTWADMSKIVNDILAKSLGKTGVYVIQALYLNQAFYVEPYWINGILRITAIRTKEQQSRYLMEQAERITKYAETFKAEVMKQKEPFDWKKENSKWSKIK